MRLLFRLVLLALASGCGFHESPSNTCDPTGPLAVTPSAPSATSSGDLFVSVDLDWASGSCDGKPTRADRSYLVDPVNGTSRITPYSRETAPVADNSTSDPTQYRVDFPAKDVRVAIFLYATAPDLSETIKIGEVRSLLTERWLADVIVDSTPPSAD
jgi:hypothetical protein